MMTPPDTADATLLCFDQLAGDVARALVRELQHNEVAQARHSSQQLVLAECVVAALRDAVATHDHAALIEAIERAEVAADEVGVVFESLRRSVFATLRPALGQNQASGELLELLGNVIAAATASEVTNRIAAARTYAAQQTTLYKMLLVMGTATDLRDLLDVIVRYADPLGAAAVHLYVFEGSERPERARCVGAWQRDGTSEAAAEVVALDSLPFRPMMVLDQLIAIENVDLDERLDPATQQSLTDSGQLAVISAPLLLDGRPIGRLWVSWQQPRHFSPYELRLIETVAFSTPTMIERLRLMSEAGGRVAELAVMRDDLERRVVEQTAAVRTFYALAENAPDGISVTTLDGVTTYANLALRGMLGYGEELVGMALGSYVAESRSVLDETARLLHEHGFAKTVQTYRRTDGTTFPAYCTSFVVPGPDGTPHAIAAVIRDLTEQRQAEQERLVLQDQVIQAQQVALRELSTPLLSLAEGVVVMPLIGSIDTTRAQEIVEGLLEGVARARARTAILDITGVPVVDTQVANALLRATQAVKLLGTQTVITGIRPEVAQTLVGLGVNLDGVVTRGTLESGVAYAFQGRSAR
jgi:PAS domain S-box-containing protein